MRGSSWHPGSQFQQLTTGPLHVVRAAAIPGGWKFVNALDAGGARLVNRHATTISQMKVSSLLRRLAAALACLCSIHFAAVHAVGETVSLRVMFLGDDGHHRPADRFKQLQ